MLTIWPPTFQVASCTFPILYHIQFKKCEDIKNLCWVIQAPNYIYSLGHVPHLYWLNNVMICHVTLQNNVKITNLSQHAFQALLKMSIQTMHTRVQFILNWKVFFNLKPLQNKTSLAAKTQRCHLCPSPLVLVIKVLRP